MTHEPVVTVSHHAVSIGHGCIIALAIFLNDSHRHDVYEVTSQADACIENRCSVFQGASEVRDAVIEGGIAVAAKATCAALACPSGFLSAGCSGKLIRPVTWSWSAIEDVA